MSKGLPKLVGIIELLPLPGAPRASEEHPVHALAYAGTRAVKEALVFMKFGFDGILLQNSGDFPFYKDSVPPETIASLSVLAAAIRETAPKIKIGIQVLKNDARAALAVAAVTGADFILVSSGFWSESGAAALFRERIRLNANQVLILSEGDASDDVETAGVDGFATNCLNLAMGVDEFSERINLLPELKKNGQVILLGSLLRGAKAKGATLDLKKVKTFAGVWKKIASKSNFKLKSKMEFKIKSKSRASARD